MGGWLTLRNQMLVFGTPAPNPTGWVQKKRTSPSPTDFVGRLPLQGGVVPLPVEIEPQPACRLCSGSPSPGGGWGFELSVCVWITLPFGGSQSACGRLVGGFEHAEALRGRASPERRS